MSQDYKFLTLNREPNPNAIFSVGNAAAFADAAGTAPVDGTGGSPSVSIAQTLATPLEGTASYLFTKTAVNSQGQGWSKDCIFQASDATKVLTLNYDYQITTGTYTGYQAPALFSDITMWFYDVTNSVMYQFSNYQVDASVSATNQYSYQGQVQVPVGCLTGRVIWFLGNTGASAFTARFNNITIGRLPRTQGAIETPWTQYAGTFQGIGTPTGVSTWWRRVGTDEEIRGLFTTGTVGATTFQIILPNANQIDNTVMTEPGICGEVSTQLTSSNSFLNAALLLVAAGSTNNISMSNVGANSSANNLSALLASTIFSSVVSYSFSAKVPIVGWGANGTLGQDSDTRVVTAKYAMGTSYVFPKALPFRFDTLSYDTHASATYGAGVTFTYFMPVAGYYQFSVGMLSDNVQNISAASDVYSVSAYKNGSTFAGGFMGAFVSGGGGITYKIEGIATGQGYFNGGDALTFVNQTNGASFLAQANPQFNYVVINRISGPAQVQAADNPNASFSTNAGQSISNAATPIIDFEDIAWDTFGCVTTGASWKFTAPRTGKIKVEAMITYASGVFTINTNVKLYVYKNGALFRKLDEDTIQATITDDFSLSGDTDVSVVAGDFIDFRTDHGESGARSLTSTTSENYCSVAYWPGF